MLPTATDSKWREALDGTNTQVATCAIDRWTAKMKGAKEYIYNQRDLTKRRRAIQKTPGSSIGGVSEEEKKNSSSDEA